MSNSIQIRTVKVELLRTGPAHNQLLSPLTPYLGICDGGEAGVVSVPFEHAAFVRKVNVLRDSGVQAKNRSPLLRELGVDIAKILGTVPRLPGALNGDAGGRDTLVHLRLVLSASELALLPFELAKEPVSPTTCGEGWLSLQARTPVVITRRTRDMSAGKVDWAATPRILFVASDPKEEGIPFDEHKKALLAAVMPYLKIYDQHGVRSKQGRREEYGRTLTVLRDATFDEVVSEFAQADPPYTHIHLLAHGAEDGNVDDLSYGLKLRDDIISGERFASALCSLVNGVIHRPTVVTLATCDSGNAGSVLIPGASMAHALHQAGIAFVVASQYPLSIQGSDLLVRDLYPGLLRGEHPLFLLHRIRTDLHGRLAVRSHDWASLVVYEALPPTLDAQLEEMRYRQAVRAMYVPFDALDDMMYASRDKVPVDLLDDLSENIDALADDLPMEGPYRLECLGVRAGARKRLAEAEYWAALARDNAGERHEGMTVCRGWLEDALRDYEEATKGFLRNQASNVKPAATLHWVLGQQLCIAAVLGQPVDRGMWEAARLSAEAYLDSDDLGLRGWAFGSLIELWLLRVVQIGPGDPQGDPSFHHASRDEARAEALKYTQELAKLVGSNDYRAQLSSTSTQILRYISWWTNPKFEDEMAKRGGGRDTGDGSWAKLGVGDLACAIYDLLKKRDRPQRWRRPRFAPPDAAGDVAAPKSVPAAEGAKSMPAAADKKAAPVVAAKSAAPHVETKTKSNGSAVPAKTTFLSAPTAKGGDTAVLRVEMLPAGHGDCLWIEYGDGPKVARVLVDCGSKITYDKVLRQRIEAQGKKDRTFELFILSHIDDDHIGGGIGLLKDANALGVLFGDVWFNGWKHLKQFGDMNAKQGEIFSELTRKNGLPWNVWRNGDAIVLPDAGSLPTRTLPGGLVLTLLSPTVDKLKTLAPKWLKEIKALGKEPGGDGFLGAARATGSTDVAALAASLFESDTAENNGSSIAVLAEYGGKSILLGADAHVPVLVPAIKRLLKARKLDKLKLDAFKLPHHGSRNNLSKELLELIECPTYLVSTDGKTFKHPDAEAIGRVIKFGGDRPRLLFNYESSFSGIWKPADLQKKYGYEAVYPADPKKPGLILTL